MVAEEVAELLFERGLVRPCGSDAGGVMPESLLHGDEVVGAFGGRYDGDSVVMVEGCSEGIAVSGGGFEGREGLVQALGAFEFEVGAGLVAFGGEELDELFAVILEEGDGTFDFAGIGVETGAGLTGL